MYTAGASRTAHPGPSPFIATKALAWVGAVRVGHAGGSIPLESTQASAFEPALTRRASLLFEECLNKSKLVG